MEELNASSPYTSNAKLNADLEQHPPNVTALANSVNYGNRVPPPPLYTTDPFSPSPEDTSPVYAEAKEIEEGGRKKSPRIIKDGQKEDPELVREALMK